MATGKTIGERLAEMIEWAANGFPTPQPACLVQMESEDPDGHARTMAALRLFVTSCRDKEDALSRAHALATVR